MECEGNGNLLYRQQGTSEERLGWLYHGQASDALFRGERVGRIRREMMGDWNRYT